MEKDAQTKELFQRFVKTGKIKDYLSYKEKERSKDGLKGRHSNKDYKL